MSDLLFSEFRLGPSALKNRVVMGPMTRSRSIGNVPGPIVATYYAQRSEAGLILTEGTSPSPDGLGYARIPGLFDAAQVAGWRAVTDAVHAKGGKIVVQLMHTGRVGHEKNLPAGARVLGPSAIGAGGKMYVDGEGELPEPTPEAMSPADVDAAVAEYAESAKLAIEAGFDGIELHGANGYLIDQFLNTASNQRTDEWGGSLEGRAKFALEVAKRCAAAIGGDRVGIRLSPYGVFNGMKPDPTTDELYETLAAGLREAGLAYIHTVDHESMGAPHVPQAVKDKIRAAFGGTIILSGGYDRARAEADLAAGRGELVSFSRPFISNPKLVTKLREDRELRPSDPSTYYTPGEKGYTDYPAD